MLFWISADFEVGWAGAGGEKGRGGRIVYIKSKRKQRHWRSFAVTQILLHSRFQASITIILLKLWALDSLGRLKADTNAGVLCSPQCPVLQGKPNKTMVWGVLTCEILPRKPAELQGSRGLPGALWACVEIRKKSFTSSGPLPPLSVHRAPWLPSSHR